MLKTSTMVLAAGLIVFSSHNASAETGARFEETVSGWFVAEYQNHCSMLKRFDVPGSLEVFYARYTDGTALVMMSDKNWSFAENETFIPTFEFEGGRKLRAYVTTTSVDQDKAYRFRLDKQTAGLIAAEWIKSGKVRITYLDKELASFPLDGAAQASAAVDRCLAEIGSRQSTATAPAAGPTQPARPGPRTLPSTVPAYLLPRATPLSDPASWQTWADYPVAARREGRQGATTVRITVGLDGRAQKCELIESSGSSDLDAATCDVLRRSGRWKNATDAQGRNLVSAWAVRMRWQLSN